jgi:UDP-glucuronate 4-epimerase
MKILVTGAAGFIGFHLARRLAGRGDEVIGIDSINDYYDRELKFARLAEMGVDREAESWCMSVRSEKYPSLSFVRMKLEDRAAIERLFESSRIERVVNLAAQAGVRYSLDHPYEYIDSNIVGFMNILESCRQQSIEHLVYASSSSVYGLNDTRPFSTHDNVDHPVSLYAATKKANELMAHSYSHLYGLPTTGMRFFTVYGPWGRPDMAYFKFAKAIMEGMPIEVYNNGDMWRDFTYIDDIVEGVVRVLDEAPEPDPTWDRKRPDPAGSSAPYRVYNLGNNRTVRLSVFIEELETALGRKTVKNYLPMQAGDVYATEADIEPLVSQFGWKPDTELQVGLRNFVEWLKRY